MAEVYTFCAPFEAVAKSKKALNHKDTKAQRKPFLSAGRRGPKKTLCLRVFVAPFFSEPFATPSFDVVAKGLGPQRKVYRAHYDFLPSST